MRCTMRVCHRTLEKQSHVTGGGGPQELQQHTSIPSVFVLGALVPAVFLATWSVRTPSTTGGVGKSDHSGKTAFTLLTVDHALLLFTQLPSSCGHVIKSKFFVYLFFIASSNAQITRCVDASCGFGTAGVSETDLLDLRTSSSWCSCSVRCSRHVACNGGAEWAIRPQRQNITHSSRDKLQFV